jgi:hypothetical protein
MANKTVRDLKVAAGRFGGTVECDQHGEYGWYTYQAIAPAGRVWGCSGDIHMILVEWRKEWPEGKQEAIVDAIDRIGHGVDDCPYGDECDCCFPEA